ncbi:hypothetical protein N481_02550 [Pseudoalteromonas luteoviolacea S4047-1]|uniref:Uncharacterized protein n=1 Tax=Pseudoalteromonas luteoviolacea S4054 TaxID=1129367 RepID=A0A0F6A674_9GAMM|nr:hypothetical protein N479_24230 [Pseudoalteromonas luteoviolacea S4054]KZN65295.1 hypothetical protein N481_02550 [Pseudoalteromonas luteoviolacea S4047-1]
MEFHTMAFIHNLGFPRVGKRYELKLVERH